MDEAGRADSEKRQSWRSCGAAARPGDGRARRPEVVLDVAATLREMEAAARADHRAMQELRMLVRRGKLQTGTVQRGRSWRRACMPFGPKFMQDEITKHLEELMQGQREIKARSV